MTSELQNKLGCYIVAFLAPQKIPSVDWSFILDDETELEAVKEKPLIDNDFKIFEILYVSVRNFYGMSIWASPIELPKTLRMQDL